MNRIRIAIAAASITVLTTLGVNIQRITDWTQGYEAPKHRTDLGAMPTFAALTEVHNPKAYGAFTAQPCAIVEYSAKWCIPCRLLKPDLAQIASTQRTTPIGSVDIDDVGLALPKLKGVQYWSSIEGDKAPLPQVVFYISGEPVDQMTGYDPHDKSKLEERIAAFTQRCDQNR